MTRDHDDSFFSDELTASELVARLLEEERHSAITPRSSGFSLLVIEA